MKSRDFYRWMSAERLAGVLGGAPSPCYVYYLPLLRDRVAALRERLGPRFRIQYAVKANPHPRILDAMAALGVGADVSSRGELDAAIAAGIPPARVSYTGPGKGLDELRAAIDRDVGAIHAESLEELDDLAAIAGEKGRRVDVGLRVNTSAGGAKPGLQMAGATHFGIAEDQIGDAVALLKARASRLRLAALHVHGGSQVLDADAIARNIRHVMDAALALEGAAGAPLASVNFGGGFGIDYFPHQDPLDLDRLGAGVASLLSEERYRGLAERAAMIVEPGRFLVAECGVYATRVRYRKRAGAKEIAVVDGGMHHNYLLSGGLGQVVRRNFALDVLPAGGAARAAVHGLELDIAGCLCTPQDVLATRARVEREVARGDHVVFFNCGAYGWSASPIDFLSRPRPAAVFVDEPRG